MAQESKKSAPSGIAQLRQSQDLSNTHDPDSMNLDDFIIPTSVASPAGITTPSPPEEIVPTPSNTGPLAIPKKSRRESEQASHPNFAPSAPSHDRSRPREFDYVQRRVRKTSIDETKVRLALGRHNKSRANLESPKRVASVPLNSLPKWWRRMGLQCQTTILTKVWQSIVWIKQPRTSLILCLPPAILMFHSISKRLA